MDERDHTEKCPTCGRLVPHGLLGEHAIKHGTATGIVPAGIFLVKPKRALGLSVGRAYSRFYSIAESITERFTLTRRIERAGMAISPSGYAAVVVEYTALSVIPAIAGLVLAFVFWSWMPLVLLASPVAVFLLLLSYLGLKADNRRDAVENEMPVLTTYLAMIVRAGGTVYTGIQNLLTSSLLPASRDECRKVVRDTEVLMRDPPTAFEKLAREHPSERFARWINGLLYADRVGGDVSRYLENSSDRSLNDLSAAWRRFSNFSMMMADAVVATFALLPLCLFVMVAGFVAAANPDLLVVYSFGVSPIIAAIIGVFLDKQSPRTPETFTQYYKMTVLTSPIGIVLAFAAFFGFKTTLQLALTIGIVAVFLPPAIMYEISSHKEAALEKALPDFLTDLTESQRVGQALETTVVRMARRRRYGNALDKILGVLAWNTTIGTPTDKAVEIATRRVSSWYSRVLFFLFKIAATTGGATVPVFERLARFSRSYNDIRRKIRMQLQTHIAIFYTTSIIVVYTVTQVIKSTLIPQVELAQQLGGISIPGIASPSPALVSILTTVIMSGTVVNSALLGLLAGKMTGGCLASGFKHMVLMVVVTAVAFMFAGVI
jgi:flagellar protein FlaJ